MAAAVLPLAGCATAEPKDEWGFEERWPYTDGVFGKVRRGASWEGGVF
jgi:hypothetical protein